MPAEYSSISRLSSAFLSPLSVTSSDQARAFGRSTAICLFLTRLGELFFPILEMEPRLLVSAINHLLNAMNGVYTIYGTYAIHE